MAEELDRVSQAFAAAIVRGERQEAIGIIDWQLRQGRDPRQLLLQVIAPALWEVGHSWHQGRLTVAHEHLATAIVQVIIAHIYERWADRRQPRSGRVLIGACLGHEQHELGVRMFCDLAENEGWSTFYLGGTVPLASLVQMVRQLEPDAVALSATMPESLPDLQAGIKALRGLPLARALTILTGGHAIQRPDQAEGADHVATDMAASLGWLTGHVPA